MAALAAAVTWPLAVRPSSGAHDGTDTFFNAWLMAWNHHALLGMEDPLEPPVFLGQPDAAGRNDLLLTQTLAALPARLAGLGPLAAHNIVLVLSLAFAGLSVFLLARELGIAPPGALFAGGAFVCMPFFQSHLWHVQLFSAGLSVLALRQAWMVSRGRGGAAWIGILVALQTMASLYYAVFLGMALILMLPWIWRAGGRRAAVKAAAWTAAGFAACIPLLWNHFQHSQRWPADMMASADLSSFVSPWESSLLTGRLRPASTAGETAFWPGIAPLLGAAAWAFRRKRGDRLEGGWFLLAVCLVFAAVSIGPTIVLFGRQLAPGPWRILADLPGFSSIRLPGRAAFLFLLPLVLFAGRTLAGRPVLAAAGILACLAEVWPGPMPLVGARPEPFHNWLYARDFEAIAILPVRYDLDDPSYECGNLLGQTVHFTPMVNGYSTSLPEGYRATAEILASWPSAEADSLLEALGVECLICRGFVPADADPVWTAGPRPVSAVVLR